MSSETYLLASTIYDVHDERGLNFTEVVMRDRDVLIRQHLSRHKGQIAFIIGSIVLLIYWYDMPRTIWANGCTIGIAIAVWLIMANLRLMKQLPHGWPVYHIYDGNIPDDVNNKENHVRSSDITKLVLRENVGRNWDDFCMEQLYMIVKRIDRPVLIYQGYSWGKKGNSAVRKKAHVLSRRWGVPLEDNRLSKGSVR